MLSDIIVSRATLHSEKIDVHQHAQLRCKWRRLMRRLLGAFG